MRKVIRRSFTAGVALAGAGAIALTPFTTPADAAPPALAHRVVTAEVTPAAFWDTTTLLTQAVHASLEQSVGAWTTTSSALFQEALNNWPIAETELAYSQIANALLVPLMPLVAGPFTEAVTEVLARSAPALRDQIELLPTFVEHGTIRLLGPFLGAIGGAGAAHAEIYWATATGDIPGFVTAVAKIPGYVIDGFLHGGYGDIGPLLSGSDGRVITPPGLLTPWNSDLLGGAAGTTATTVEVETGMDADEATEADPTGVEIDKGLSGFRRSVRDSLTVAAGGTTQDVADPEPDKAAGADEDAPDEPGTDEDTGAQETEKAAPTTEKPTKSTGTKSTKRESTDSKSRAPTGTD